MKKLLVLTACAVGLSACAEQLPDQSDDQGMFIGRRVRDYIGHAGEPPFLTLLEHDRAVLLFDPAHWPHREIGQLAARREPAAVVAHASRPGDEVWDYTVAEVVRAAARPGGGTE